MSQTQTQYRVLYYDGHSVTLETTPEHMAEVAKQIAANVDGEYPGATAFGAVLIGHGGIKSIKPVRGKRGGTP